jgi:two-component system cell cycle response regulator
MAKILVIEDNIENLELMTYLLKAFGHTTTTASDGGEGVDHAHRESPDLIICDVHLPTMDGYEVARRLKMHPALRPIPLVAVTALAMVGDRDKVLAAGFDGYLPKPIVPEVFVQQIEAFLQPHARGATPQPAAPSATAAAGPGPTKNVTILVVDDSLVNRELIRSTLEPFGYTVVLAAGVQEGLALARQVRPDVILSDLHMPDHNGFHFLTAAKADNLLSSVPFLFISSSVFGDRDKIHALERGATRFILRPIEPQALLAEIEACLNPG